MGFWSVIDLFRGGISKGLVRPMLVVLNEPVAKSQAEFAPILVGPQIDVLILQAAPKALDEPVVHPPAPSVNADLDSRIFYGIEIFPGSKLSSLVCV
jgi:hypothetical protein